MALKVFSLISILTLVACAGADPEQLDGDAEGTASTDAELDKPDFMEIPGGGAHRPCVREVPVESHIDSTGGEDVVSMNNVVKARFAPCRHRPRRGPAAAAERGGLQPPDVNGWIESSRATAPTNAWGFNWYNKMTTSWTVPSAPTATGGLTYFFPAFTPAGDTAIIQPVLSYGTNGFSGFTNAWRPSSWYISATGNVFFSLNSPSTLSPGQSVGGTMQASGCTAGGICKWSVKTQISVWNTGIFTSTAEKWTRAWRGALEAYRIDACNKLPNQNSTVFTNLNLYQPGPNTTDFNEMALTPTWTNVLFGATPDCGYSVTTSGRNTTLNY